MNEAPRLPFIGKYLRDRMVDTPEKVAQDLTEQLRAVQAEEREKAAQGAPSQSWLGGLWRSARYFAPGLPQFGTTPRATTLGGGADVGGVFLPGDRGTPPGAPAPAPGRVGTALRNLGTSMVPGFGPASKALAGVAQQPPPPKPRR